MLRKHGFGPFLSLTLKHGKLLLLAYDETDGGYYQIESDRTIAVKKFEKYRCWSKVFVS